MADTLKVSEFINLLEAAKKEFGDLPVFITAGPSLPNLKGELPINESSIRFTSNIGVHKDRKSSSMETLSGRFFVLSDL